MACKAGKDIYCQKPLSLTIADGRAMSAAVAKSGVVFQTGSQQRSDPNFRKAAELVRNGRIGDLKVCKVGLPGGRPNLAGEHGDDKEPCPVPEGFDYDFWLGPAPEAPYAPARCLRELPLDPRLLRAARSPTGAATTRTAPSGASAPS